MEILWVFVKLNVSLSHEKYKTMQAKPILGSMVQHHYIIKGANPLQVHLMDLINALVPSVQHITPKQKTKKRYASSLKAGIECGYFVFHVEVGTPVNC